MVRRQFKLVVITGALLVCSQRVGWAQLSRSLGPAGTVWGGQHVSLEVTTEGATLDFDCATGAISAPITFDRQGQFKVSGTLTREHPGPVMREGPPPAPVIYSGALTRNTLKLSIASGQQGETAEEYVLMKGRSGRVLRCK